MRAVPRLLSYKLAFALQLRRNHGKTSVRVTCKLRYYKFVPWKRDVLILEVSKSSVAWNVGILVNGSLLFA